MNMVNYSDLLLLFIIIYYHLKILLTPLKILFYLAQALKLFAQHNGFWKCAVCCVEKSCIVEI